MKAPKAKDRGICLKRQQGQTRSVVIKKIKSCDQK